MKMKSLVCSCALMVGLAGVAQAHEDVDNDGKFTLLFGGGKLFTDNGDMDDGDVGEIGLGYIIDKHWAVEAIYSDINGANVGNIDVDAEMLRLDGLYHFDQNGHWTPYLAGGIGRLKGEASVGSLSADGYETNVNFGGGLKYALSKELTARADVRALYGNDSHDTDVLATIGFNYIFGASAAQAPLDSDGDGVLDADDRCPGTPAGVAVNAKGCALDSDLDGVPNYLDKCHSTKSNVRVDRDGCPLFGSDAVSIELEVLFDVNKAEIKPEFMAEIQSVAEFMDQYKSAYAVIEGHTDSIGDADYNKSLSQSRADAVLDVLVKKMGVNSQRLTAEGFGEERPRATNDNREGRQLNRRVVAVLKAEVKKVLTK